MSANAATADGLVGCSAAQAQLGQPDPVACPAASRLGTMQIETPVLDGALRGNVFLAARESDPLGSLLGLYVAAVIRRPGSSEAAGQIEADPLTVGYGVVPELAAVALFDFELRLKVAKRAVLVIPRRLRHLSRRRRSGRLGEPARQRRISSSFAIDQGCGRRGQFTPGFEAGTRNRAAGKIFPFALRVTRPDGQQNIARVEATLPQGLLARLAGVRRLPPGPCRLRPAARRPAVSAPPRSARRGAQPDLPPQPGRAPSAVYLAGPHGEPPTA